MRFEPRLLGQTGRTVGAIGLASSYGAPADVVRYAFDLGVRYFYWGSRRTATFGEGLRSQNARREDYVLVIQSYSRIASLVGWSLERALRELKTDYTDVLLLGLWNRLPAARIVDACVRLRDRGRTRHIALSTHRRQLIPRLIDAQTFDIFHVRYNAKHRGAEREVFPYLTAANRPGLVSFTATSWRQLLNERAMPPGERTPTAAECYRFVLSHPAVDVCMAAPANMEQAHDISRALYAGPMDENDLAWMRRIGDHLYGERDRPYSAGDLRPRSAQENGKDDHS